MMKTPGRPKKSQQEKAPKNGTRDRQYSIVIHDIKKGLKNIIDKKVDALKPDWHLVAEEEYNHQDGHHIHVFLKYKEKKAFSTVLNFFKKISEENEAGRVQVDSGRGTLEQCEKYLVNPDKEKNVDEDIVKNVRRRSREEVNSYLAAKYPHESEPCEICNKPTYVGPPLYYTNTAGQLVELTCVWLCPGCQKKISAQGIRQDATTQICPS